MLNGIVEALALAGTLLPLVVVLPLMAALAIGTRLVAGVHGDDSEPATAGLARGAGSPRCSCWQHWPSAVLPRRRRARRPGEWFAAPGFAVNLSFASDTRSLLLAMVVAFIGCDAGLLDQLPASRSRLPSLLPGHACSSPACS